MKTGRIEYSNGYYVGEVDASGKEHGKGEIFFKDGSHMKGEWVQGMRNGYFEIRNPNGFLYYKGEYNHKGYNGKGEYIFDNGTKIVGEFHNNEPYYGTIYWADNGKPNGDSCTGKFIQWNLYGECILHQRNGEEWKTMWEGMGKMTRISRIK